MPSSPSSSSSSDTSTSPEAQQLYLLTNVELLRELYLSDVTPLPEPNVERFPVLRIGFSSPFDTVYGAYRALRSDMNHLLTMCARQAVAAVPPGATARWLLLLAFALRQCMSHYTAWHDRRELILQPRALQHATRQALRQLPFVPVVPEDDKDRRALLQQITEHWLPSLDDLELPSNVATNASGTTVDDPEENEEEQAAPCRVSLWRAVRWELRTTQCIGLLYHKNFQVWHHRKDLISRALQTLPEDVLEAILASKDACNDYLERHHAVSFADLDERQITAQVFEEYDAKNYHVWLHRAWFINAFPFIVEGPQWAEWCAARASSPQETFSADEDGSLPACPLKAEVDFTGDLIESDWWNNSAWCHRYHLFEQHVAALWLQQLRAGTLSPSQVLAAAHTVLRAEVGFALRWAMKEVSNECPFTYSLSIASLYQRLLLCVHYQEAGGEGFVMDDVSPLTAVSRAAPWSSLQSCVPVRCFLQGFSLLFHLLRVLEEEVRPIADGYRDTLYRTLARVDTKDHPFLHHLHETQTQFGVDNLHQVRTAIYHSCFYFLRVCWVTYMDAEAKAAAQSRRPSEAYATQGVTDELLDSAAWQRVLHEWSNETSPLDGPECNMELLLSTFLLVEATALATAKLLVVEDEIRVKYWKREITTVLFREYN